MFDDAKDYCERGRSQDDSNLKFPGATYSFSHMVLLLLF